MNITIGNKIKQLRRRKGITQEQLAESLGISFQAISKWENNIALPDITLVPTLANFFEVSIDELFDYNLKELHAKVKNICDEAYRFREKEPAKSRAILEDGLKKYPDNEVLLNNLLYVMNGTKEPEETIKLASRLIAETNDDSVKYDALRFLAYAYSAKRDDESAKSAIEQIPELYFTKLSEAAFILKGHEKYLAAEKEKWISFEILLQMCAKIAETYEEDSKFSAAIAEYNLALNLVNVMKTEPKIERFGSYVDFFNKKLEHLASQHASLKP
jgi:transcriptional regulator with XRE-family HTH domain